MVPVVLIPNHHPSGPCAGGDAYGPLLHCQTYQAHVFRNLRKKVDVRSLPQQVTQSDLQNSNENTSTEWGELAIQTVSSVFSLAVGQGT